MKKFLHTMPEVLRGLRLACQVNELSDNELCGVTPSFKCLIILK